MAYTRFELETSLLAKKDVTTTSLKVKDFDGYSNKNTTRLRKAQDKDIKYLGCQVTLDKEEAYEELSVKSPLFTSEIIFSRT